MHLFACTVYVGRWAKSVQGVQLTAKIAPSERTHSPRTNAVTDQKNAIIKISQRRLETCSCSGEGVCQTSSGGCRFSDASDRLKSQGPDAADDGLAQPATTVTDAVVNFGQLRMDSANTISS